MKGSGTFCAVANCRNCRKRALELDRPISFHRFPKNAELRQIWVDRCRRPWEFKIDTSFICSDHFEESDFLRDLKAELLGLKEVRRLKEGAIPTLNLPPEVVEVPELGDSLSLCEEQRQQQQLLQSLQLQQQAQEADQVTLVYEQQQEEELDIEPKINISDLNEFLLVDNLEELVDESLEVGDLLCNAFDDEDHYIILDISNPT